MTAPATGGSRVGDAVLDRENVHAVAAARGLAPEDLEIRLRADASSAVVVLVLFTAAIAWLLIGSIFGDIASIKLHWPDFLTRYAWLTFGRVRTAHLHAVNYGWATAALIGTSLWLLPCLIHTELKSPVAALIGGALFTLGIAVGIVGVLLGYNGGMEWLEANRYAAGPLLVVGGGLVALSLFHTASARRAEHLYVSVWYIL